MNEKALTCLRANPPMHLSWLQILKKEAYVASEFLLEAWDENPKLTFLVNFMSIVSCLSQRIVSWVVLKKLCNNMVA